MDKITQIENMIKSLDNKDFKLYFFTLDTKGNPTAGVANIYQHVKLLNELGYKAFILHEKPDYKLRGDETSMGISDWLGEEYANLPHASIEGPGLNIAHHDFVIIPEVFSTLMDQIKGFPCRKIVLCQSHEYIFDILPIGKKWDFDYGFRHVITTSKKQSEYVKNHFPLINTYEVPVSIPSYFKPSEKPKQPIIALSTRNPSDASKIAKSFYLQYPIYKWVTFKDMRGMSRKLFAEELGKACLAVWVDDVSGFGTFPVEAIECETPVIGKMPNMIPEWMESKNEEGNNNIKNNGIWTNTILNIPELIAQFMKLWFEDSIPSDITNEIIKSKGQYTEQNQKDAIKNVYETIIAERKEEFNNMIKTTKAEVK